MTPRWLHRILPALMLFAGSHPVPAAETAAAVGYPAKASKKKAPRITEHPVSQAVPLSARAFFTVRASGSSLKYRWQESTNGSKWSNVKSGSGKGSATYATPPVTAALRGRRYRVVVSNAKGKVTSSAAVLSLLAAPEITSFSASPATIASGGSSTLSWSVTGAVTQLTLEPGLGPVPSSGHLAVSPTTATDYTLVAANAAGRVSRTVAVRMEPISATLAPALAPLSPGDVQTFVARVTGTSNTAVTWAVDGEVNGSEAAGRIAGTGSTVRYTAPATPGTHTITATAVADGSAVASASVKVSTGCAPEPTSPQQVSVKDYGAKGDGVTDDTAAIQRAVDAMAGTGGTVVVPPGTYGVNALAHSNRYGVFLKSGLTFRLEAGATLKALPNADASQNYILLLISGVSDVNVVGGGCIEGNLGTHADTGGESGICIQISNRSQRVTIENITVKEAWGDGIYVSTASGVTLCNVTADHNRRAGISIVEVDQMTVKDSVFKRSTGFVSSGEFWCGAGINIEPNRGQTVSHVTIRGCTFTDNAGPGISSGLAGSNANAAFTHDIVIDQNRITRNGAAADPAPGIEISGATQNQWVTGNLVEGNTSIGIYVRSGATGIQVSGNTVNQTRAVPGARWVIYRPGHGIVLANVGGNTVTGNSGTDNAGCGVYQVNPTAPNTIQDNQVGGTGTCP